MAAAGTAFATDILVCYKGNQFPRHTFSAVRYSLYNTCTSVLYILRPFLFSAT